MTDIIKEFDEKFKNGFSFSDWSNRGKASPGQIKSFILKALSSQKKELLEKIEKMKEEEQRWNEHVGEEAERFEKETERIISYNQALEDIEKLLT